MKADAAVHCTWRYTAVGNYKTFCGTDRGIYFNDAVISAVTCKACRVQIARAFRVGAVGFSDRGHLRVLGEDDSDAVFPETANIADEELLRELEMLESKQVLMLLEGP